MKLTISVFAHFIEHNSYHFDHFVEVRVSDIYQEYLNWAKYRRWKIIKADTFRRQCLTYFPYLTTRNGIYKLKK